MRHCEPFASCHSDPVSSTGEESTHFAQGKLRETISRDCHACAPKRFSAQARRFAPRNDYFSESVTIINQNIPKTGPHRCFFKSIIRIYPIDVKD